MAGPWSDGRTVQTQWLPLRLVSKWMTRVAEMRALNMSLPSQSFFSVFFIAFTLLKEKKLKRYNNILETKKQG